MCQWWEFWTIWIRWFDDISNWQYILDRLSAMPQYLNQLKCSCNSKIDKWWNYTCLSPKKLNQVKLVLVCHQKLNQVKLKVWKSALCSSILYGCETWLTKDLRAVEPIYVSTLKSALGVRTTTCNDLVFLECGEVDAATHVRQQQFKFLKKLTSRESYPSSYIEWIIKEAIRCRSPSGIVLQQIMDNRGDYVIQSSEKLKHKVGLSQSTRRAAYRALNPALSVSDAYQKIIPEYARKAFTRFRLSSHRLQYETGRWSRIQPEDRKCHCGETQTDSHVMLSCVLTRDIRAKYHITAQSLSDLFDNGSIPTHELCNFICDVMDTLYNVL